MLIYNTFTLCNLWPLSPLSLFYPASLSLPCLLSICYFNLPFSYLHISALSLSIFSASLPYLSLLFFSQYYLHLSYLCLCSSSSCILCISPISVSGLLPSLSSASLMSHCLCPSFVYIICLSPISVSALLLSLFSASFLLYPCLCSSLIYCTFCASLLSPFLCCSSVFSLPLFGLPASALLLSVFFVSSISLYLDSCRNSLCLSDICLWYPIYILFLSSISLCPIVSVLLSASLCLFLSTIFLLCFSLLYIFCLSSIHVSARFLSILSVSHLPLPAFLLCLLSAICPISAFLCTVVLRRLFAQQRIAIT